MPFTMGKRTLIQFLQFIQIPSSLGSKVGAGQIDEEKKSDELQVILSQESSGFTYYNSFPEQARPGAVLGFSKGAEGMQTRDSFPRKERPWH